MARKHWFLLLAGLVVGILISGHFALLAQDRRETPRATPNPAPRQESAEQSSVSLEPAKSNETPTVARASGHSASAGTIQDALLRPYRFPFSRPTTLEQVCAHLKDTLRAAVVIDLAALGRNSIDRGATVQLELEGVRLKTGLKLLLDQVGLTYRVVAEDNLLVITDTEGSEDSTEKIWAELRALHRDLHEVQDAIDELRDSLGDDGGAAPRVRKPTIIEEMPEMIEEKPGKGPEKPGRAGEKRDGAGAPAPGSRKLPPRVPLAGPRRGV